MRIGVPREIYAGEKRVATTPDVARLSPVQAPPRIILTRPMNRPAVLSQLLRLKSGLMPT